MSAIDTNATPAIAFLAQCLAGRESRRRPDHVAAGRPPATRDRR